MRSHVLVANLLGRASTSQDLSAGALSFTTDIEYGFTPESIAIHASAGITETFTASMDSILGTNYDYKIFDEAFAGGQDFLLISGKDFPRDIFFGGDQMKIECTNANTTGIVYVTFKYQQIV